MIYLRFSLFVLNFIILVCGSVFLTSFFPFLFPSIPLCWELTLELVDSNVSSLFNSEVMDHCLNCFLFSGFSISCIVPRKFVEIIIILLLAYFLSKCFMLFVCCRVYSIAAVFIGVWEVVLFDFILSFFKETWFFLTDVLM